MKSSDYYEVLGVERSASESEITKARGGFWNGFRWISEDGGVVL